MSTARDDILSNIRRSLGVHGKEAPRLASVQNRLAQTPAGVIPARGQLEGETKTAMFIEQAEMVQASVARLASAAEIPAEVARYLREHNLPATIRMGADPLLTALDWNATSMALSQGPSTGHDLNAISVASAGFAETGSLMLTSGQDNPTTLNFLPDTHFVVLKTSDIEVGLESMWQRLRARFGKALMPRTVNFITGPSRSADIEQSMLLGAHGPRSLHILLIETA